MKACSLCYSLNFVSNEVLKKKLWEKIHELKGYIQNRWGIMGLELSLIFITLISVFSKADVSFFQKGLVQCQEIITGHGRNV